MLTIVEQEILEQAVNALKKSLPPMSDGIISIRETDTGDKKYDAIINILNVDFVCNIEKNVTTSTFNSILNRMQRLSEEDACVLLIARYISPALSDELACNGINYLDSVGNCFIRYMEGNECVIQLSNKGQKNVPIKEKSYPVFQEAGIKVIFYLMQQPENANKTYREIQEATGVSLGSVKNVISELIARDFLLTTQSGRVLKNKRKLLDLWVENYNETLKPKLLLGRMSFRTSELQTKWLAMELPEGMYWGGESAAHMVENYLEPGSFDIYTDIPAANLMKTGFVKQDECGEIRIYGKFWNWNTDNHLVPLILIYADLMGSGNSRCLEMAKRLLDNELNDYK